MTFHNTFSILIFFVEFGTLYTIVTSLIAGFAGLITINLADAFINIFILNTLAVCSWETALSDFEFISLHTA